jgi:hypothetical protein
MVIIQLIHARGAIALRSVHLLANLQHASEWRNKYLLCPYIFPRKMLGSFVKKIPLYVWHHYMPSFGMNKIPGEYKSSLKSTNAFWAAKSLKIS